MTFSETVHELWTHKLKFFLVFFIVLVVSYMLLVAIDFVPEAPAEETVPVLTEDESLTAPTDTPIVPAVMDEELVALPTAIYIERLQKTVAVLNPVSRTIADLDNALLNGVVRHPDSALVGQTGNVFILGHSSYLPNVLNRNFQAFNGIEKLEWGDRIEVTSDTHVYVYRVEKVYKARAQDLTVPISVSEKKLTLATCNSFGSIDDRFIVEAYQVDVRPREA